MFTAIASILGDQEKISLEITGVGKDRQMKVVIKPQLAKGGNIALAQPLALVATPEELEAGFIESLATYGVERTSLKEQVQVTTTIMAAAKQTEAGKASKALQSKSKQSPSASSPSEAAAEDGDSVLEDDDEVKDKASSSSPAATAAPKNTNDDLLDLLS
ncbi:PRTRC system protein E [Pseudoduganella sp. R-34]|uniref:PRTRC system protein E n=1 Tax=Pseudoduganella sp. R-34 TaxID=3404062 RepID=UPI003CF2BDE8